MSPAFSNYDTWKLRSPYDDGDSAAVEAADEALEEECWLDYLASHLDPAADFDPDEIFAAGESETK